MVGIDIAFCTGLLKEVGDDLYAKFTEMQGTPPHDFEELAHRFQQHNGQAEEVLRSVLQANYPDIRWSDGEFDLEEQRQAMRSGDCWICDPLDGAFHFFQGFTFWSTALCLTRDGAPVFSAVYDPCRRELFHAVQGEGAYLNGTRIGAGQKRELKHAVVATSHPTLVSKDGRLVQTVQGLSRVMSRSMITRMLGSVSLQLAYVANGRLDAYWEHGNDTFDWLPGALLVQEAGGTVTDTEGRPFGQGPGGIAAASRMLHPQLIAALQEEAV
ncbi:inositol monophosphatase family protein [Paenibacillus ehimensis]|uniref:Inositol monophosphatase family protein n=1 Tax=Paenibacillus ehimensis TaxID=79264 RepID=A0ABT8V4P6_9BACL|nr:inositol monophosphatase family protein [Paenibacillus ehimensis]MDO3676403.1 inositol monophosphatase family protein [Paenibacillus ehimensis]